MIGDSQKTVAPCLVRLSDLISKHMPTGAYQAIHYNYHWRLAPTGEPLVTPNIGKGL